MIVYRLAPEQAESLRGEEFAPDSYFNANVLNGTGQYFLSIEEVNQCVNPDYQWVKNLPQVEYVPPVQPGEI